MRVRRARTRDRTSRDQAVYRGARGQEGVENDVVSIEEDGGILFTVGIPEARSVEIVGAFDGWHEERHAMAPSGDGVWAARLDPGPGSFLFRYLVDGRAWVVDEEAHGLVVAADGWEKSRVYQPPTDRSPDAMAA